MNARHMVLLLLLFTAIGLILASWVPDLWEVWLAF